MTDLIICHRCENPCGPTVEWVDGQPLCFVCAPGPALATPSTPGAGQGRVSGPPWPSGCQSGAGDGLVMDDAPLVCAYCDEVCQLRPAETGTGTVVSPTDQTKERRA